MLGGKLDGEATTALLWVTSLFVFEGLVLEVLRQIC